MVEARIGYRYAKALLEQAHASKVLNDTRDDMLMVYETCKNSRELVNLLESPIIKVSQKHDALKNIFYDKFETELSAQTIDLLIRKGRESYIPHVAKAFLDLYDQEHDIMRGVLTSAYKLPTELFSQIRDRMEGKLNKTLMLEQKVDKEMIGGFKIQIGDQLYDGSVLTALRKLRNKFHEN